MHMLLDIHPQFQSDVNFDEVERSGVKGVYIKATEGVDLFAPNFIEYQRRARQQNLRTGFYHFAHPRPGRSGAREAEWFYAKVCGVRAGVGRAQLLRLVIDVEETHFTGLLKNFRTRRYTRQLANRLKVLAEHEPVLYTYPSFLNRWGKALGRLQLWIAHYDVQRPILPKPFKRYVMWQYTQTGINRGVAGRVDKNKCPQLSDLILNRSEY